MISLRILPIPRGLRQTMVCMPVTINSYLSIPNSGLTQRKSILFVKQIHCYGKTRVGGGTSCFHKASMRAGKELWGHGLLGVHSETRGEVLRVRVYKWGAPWGGSSKGPSMGRWRARGEREGSWDSPWFSLLFGPGQRLFVYSYRTKQNGIETLIQWEDFTIIPFFLSFFLAVCFYK